MRKLLVFAFMILCLGSLSTGCGNSLPNPETTGTKEFNWDPYQTTPVPGVMDDNQGSAYIMVKEPKSWEENLSIQELTRKKIAWQKTYPAKRIISISVVGGTQPDSVTAPVVKGLLIQYELLPQYPPE